MLSFAVEYCRKILSKNLIEKSCQKTLYNTIFFDIIQQISPKTSRRCKKCGSFLAYIVENLCYFLAKNDVVDCCIIQFFSTNYLSKNLSKKTRCLMSKNLIKIYCRKMFVNNLTTKFVKLIF